MNPINKDFLQETENYLSILEKNKNKQYDFIAEIESYKHLGYSLLSILRVCHSALVAKEEYIRYHTDLDIYSLLDLAKSLIPESEFEFLDKLKKEIEKRKSKINSRKISKKLKILEKLLDRQDF